MHFSVLSSLTLPKDIPGAIKNMAVDDVANFATRKLYLKSLSDKKIFTPSKVASELTDLERWECFVETLAAGLLEPYNENTTNIAYMCFDDRTEEGRKAYKQDCLDCVKTPDGRIIDCYRYEFSHRYELYNGKVCRKSFGRLHHPKQTKKAKKYAALPNYPLRKLYPKFDVFMTDYWGCELEEKTGYYGYYINPNGQWDWWEIGGRWPFRFLVKDDCCLTVAGEFSSLYGDMPHYEAPEGYHWVAGARKGDIAWDMMREFICSKQIEQFLLYQAWFAAGEIPPEHTGQATITQDGIVSWGGYLYHQEESLEHYLNCRGLSDNYLYPICPLALVDVDGWNDQGWGASDSSEVDTEVWLKAVDDFIVKQPDDALLVSVDCHT